MPTPITSTTQNQILVYDIQDNLIILKDGSAAMVIQTTAVNFGLLSEQEQDAIIYAYAAFLNSLNFSIQILVRSEKKDISSYLKLLSDATAKQPDPVKKKRISKYRTFINETIKQQNVLDKKFYLIIPFFALELGSVKSLTRSVSAGLRQTKQAVKLPTSLSNIIKKASTTLVPKRDHILKQLERIGLTATQLNNKELLSLLYRTHNPGATIAPVTPEQLTAPLVEPVIKAPKRPTPSPKPQKKTNEQKTENNDNTTSSPTFTHNSQPK